MSWLNCFPIIHVFKGTYQCIATRTNFWFTTETYLLLEPIIPSVLQIDIPCLPFLSLHSTLYEDMNLWWQHNKQTKTICQRLTHLAGPLHQINQYSRHSMKFRCVNEVKTNPLVVVDKVKVKLNPSHILLIVSSLHSSPFYFLCFKYKIKQQIHIPWIKNWNTVS